MARDIWVTSDTHFLHSNILDFEDGNGEKIRGRFSDVDHMNETMIENWNRLVKQGDIVYHLGDVFIGRKEEFQKLWPRLNGRKRLIVGNHDDIKYLSSGGFFQKVQMWRQWRDERLLFSHVPIHESSADRGHEQAQLLNVHGHTHQHGSPDGAYYSVCVELQDYTPVHIDKLIQIANKKL